VSSLYNRVDAPILSGHPYEPPKIAIEIFKHRAGALSPAHGGCLFVIARGINPEAISEIATPSARNDRRNLLNNRTTNVVSR